MSSTAVPPSATGVITIDLDRLAANWSALAALVKPAQCAAVVKADAYGVGAWQVIPKLAREGCRAFFVATLAEAVAARRLAPDADIYVLDGTMPGTAAEFSAAGVRPVLSTLADVREWAQHCREREVRHPAALHIDSGLNRLGLSVAEVQAIADDAGLREAFDLKLVMSHLASADDPIDPKNEQQRLAFDERRALLPPAPASLAASDGLMLGPYFHYDLVRPGYALYGGQASRASAAPVAPIVKVSVRVLQVAEVGQGETVGYSATYAIDKPSRIATIAAGYADGVARSLSATNGEGGGFVAIRGTLAPIVGRVSMDLITVDVSDVPGAPVERGDWVDLIGPDITIEAMGANARTIGYEVLTRLGPRFHRIYLGAQE